MYLAKMELSREEKHHINIIRAVMAAHGQPIGKVELIDLLHGYDVLSPGTCKVLFRKMLTRGIILSETKERKIYYSLPKMPGSSAR